MKLPGLLFASSALLLIGACSQDHEEASDVAGQVVEAPEVVVEAGENVTSAFVTAPLINPNTANVEIIAAIPGVGKALAQQVISGRPYATPTQLHAILKGVVDADQLKAIYSVMFVTVDLNNGSSADYQLIPTTMSPKRLAHEFEEYRPYHSMEQFSREMSKYVSAEEVAFLQRYVTVN